MASLTPTGILISRDDERTFYGGGLSLASQLAISSNTMAYDWMLMPWGRTSQIYVGWFKLLDRLYIEYLSKKKKSFHPSPYRASI